MNKNVFEFISKNFIACMVFSIPFTSGIVLFKGINIPIFFLLCAIFCIFLNIFAMKRLTIINNSELYLSLIACWAFTSNIWTINASLSSTWSYYYLLIAISYITIRRVINSWDDWYYLGYSYLFGCVVAAIIILVKWKLGISSGAERFTIDGINANFIGYSLATAMPVIAALILSYEYNSIIRTAIIIIITIILLMAIMLSGCRSALYASIACLLVFLMRILMSRSIIKMLLLVFVPIVAWRLYIQLPDILRVRLFTLTDPLYDPSGNADLSGRLTVWPIGIRIFTEHLLLGVGAGTFQDINPLGIGAHNVFISLAVELGIIGLLLYVIAAILSLIPSIKSGYKQWEFWAGISLLFTWTIIAFSGVWEVSMAAWFAFAWISKIKVSYNKYYD